MNINELISNNTEKIEIFVIILEHLKNEFNILYDFYVVLVLFNPAPN